MLIPELMTEHPHRSVIGLGPELREGFEPVGIDDNSRRSPVEPSVRQVIVAEAHFPDKASTVALVSSRRVPGQIEVGAREFTGKVSSGQSQVERSVFPDVVRYKFECSTVFRTGSIWM
jgi:hypothetical protein